MQNEFQIKNDQTDLISDIQFSSIDNKLLSASWDNVISNYKQSINIYGTEKWDIIHKIKSDSPELSASFHINDTSKVYSAGLSGAIVQFNLLDLKKTVIGEHNKPISKILLDVEYGNIYSGSWDRTIKSWDIRKEKEQIFSICMDDKVHGICQTLNKIIITEGNNLIKIYEKRKVKEPIRTINLNSQIRCVNSNKEKGLLIGYYEGKISIENFNQTEGYSFKCHRIEKENEIIAYPVNSIESHPNKEYFTSVGSDGFIYFWDNEKKKKIRRSHEYSGRYNID